MYVFYSLLLFFALLLYAPAIFFKGRGRAKTPLHLKERLGLKLLPRTGDNPCLWIHAVSVGEALSLRNLIREIKAKHPSWEIYFSTLTGAGYGVAKEKLREADAVFFVPLDFAFIIRKFFAAIRPSLFVLVESEFWPHLLRAAKKNGAAVLLVNGRISARAFRSYHRLKSLVQGMFKNIDRFLVQTKQDKERLEKLGVSPELVEVSGNLKSEVHLPVLQREDVLNIKTKLGLSPQKRVIVAGSTHPGEEELLLGAYAQAKKEREDLVFILAPRHPQRAEEVEAIARRLSLRVMRRTNADPGRTWDVLILDTIGELAHFYALADLAFVGGSLVAKGGQNLLEPAFYEKPLFFGPHMENFANLAAEFVSSQAAGVVSTEKELAELFRLKNERSLLEMARRGKGLLNSLEGATQKTLCAIENLMSDTAARL